MRKKLHFIFNNDFNLAVLMAIMAVIMILVLNFGKFTHKEKIIINSEGIDGSKDVMSFIE